MRPANERRRYSVTSSLIGRALTKWSLKIFLMLYFQTHFKDWYIDDFHMKFSSDEYQTTSLSTPIPLMAWCHQGTSCYLNQCCQNSLTPCMLWCPQGPTTWWCHQMETFSALLAFCVGNSPVTGEFPAQRSATRNFDIFFDQRLNKRLSKQWRGWWFVTPSCSL